MFEPTNQTSQLRRRRRRAPAIAVAAIVGLSALVFSARSLSASETAFGSTDAPAASLDQTATAGVSPQPVGPVALKPGSPPQVAAWNAGPGGATLAAISAHLGTVLMAHDERQFVQMKRECASLASAATAASAQPAIPDSAMENLYTTALASLAAGAANCQAAVSSHQEGDEDLITTTNSSLLRSEE